jgi:biopolymer transport protein ExbB/TolQ
MNNTAFGLTIAVVCIVAHLLLSSKAKAMVEEIEYSALRLENLLSRRGAGETAPLESAGGAS